MYNKIHIAKIYTTRYIQYIEQGMGLIESIDHKGFHTYLKQFQNTICGRHPISILLAVRIVSTFNLIKLTKLCFLIHPVNIFDIEFYYLAL